MKTRLALAAAVVACAAVSLPAQAAGGGATKAVAATGVVKLVGDGTGYARVRLTTPAVLVDPSAQPGSVKATGSSPFVGFALVSDARPRRHVLVGGRLPFRNISKSTQSTTVAIPLAGFPFGSEYRIPAGAYRLYLLTDGKPASVTLRFKGLPGSSTIKAAAPVPFAMQRPTVRLTTPGMNHYQAGGHTALRSDGLAFTAGLTKTAAFLSRREEVCLYERQTTAADFGPNCGTDGYGGAFVTTDLSSAASGGALLSYGGVPYTTPGVKGLGFNAQVAGQVTSIEQMTFMLNYA